MSAANKIPPIDPTVPPGPVTRLFHRFVMSPPGLWFAINIASRIDPFLMKLTGGRISSGIVFRVVVVTAPGRKSGEPRTVPLLYFTQGDEVILIASSYGRPKNPAWYYNLTGAGEATLSRAGVTRRYAVRETEGEERDQLYGLAEQLYAGYGQYAEKAGRKIPVLALSPR